MKRNKAQARKTRSGKSPYAKYGKRPYQYSPAYYAWKREAMRGASTLDLAIERKSNVQ